MEDKSGDNLAMSSKPQILWIDDDPGRKRRAMDLKDESGMSVEFISLNNKDLEKEKISIRNNYKPELVIIDHILDKTKPTGGTHLGSTLTGFLRENWEECPFLGITAVGNIPKIDIEKYIYDEFIEGDRFSEYVRYIPNVVKGFKKSVNADSIEEWIGWLNPPKEEIERIKRCMPHNVKIKTDIHKKGFANRIYRWFRTKFYCMPGFLYDKDWVATFIGVKSEAIDRYLEHFDKAKYSGIFNDPDNPRWWKARLYQIIYGKCKDKITASRNPQDVGNEVLKVKKKDRSICYVCKEKWPETIAYVDESDIASAEQMHLRCTLAHPLYRYEPMFEEIRMMRTD